MLAEHALTASMGEKNMPGSYYNLGLRDSSNEVSSTKWNVGDLTILTLGAALTQMGALEAAIDGVTIGAIASSAWGDSDSRAYVRPSDAQSQRGIKWTVSWEDTVTFSKGTNTIPTANLDLLPLVGAVRTEDLDLTANPGLALVNAIEALCKSPAGNALKVLRVYFSD